MASMWQGSAVQPSGGVPCPQARTESCWEDSRSFTAASPAVDELCLMPGRNVLWEGALCSFQRIREYPESEETHKDH